MRLSPLLESVAVLLLPVDLVILDRAPSVESGLLITWVLDVRARRGSILAGRSEFQDDVGVVPIVSKDTEFESVDRLVIVPASGRIYIIGDLTTEKR